MPKKKVSEMNYYERLHFSLGGRTLRGTLLYSLIISLAATGFGFYLYTASIRHEYRTKSWQMSRTAATMIDEEEARKEAEAVIRIYNSMTEEEKNQLQDKDSPLLSRFDEVRDEGFEEMRKFILEIQTANGGKAGFTAFIDPATNRRVFIADSDPKDSFCPPGSWDVYTEEMIRDLEQGRTELFDWLLGGGAIPASPLKMKPYGYRCMGATKLFEVEGYPVYVIYDTDMSQVIRIGLHLFLWFGGFLLIITVLAVWLAYRNTQKTVVAPIQELTAAAGSYISDRADSHRSGAHFGKLNIRTGDEIEYLSSTMQAMEQDLSGYIVNLTRITAEKERISTELSLASQIQASMMPHIFPPYPDRNEFDIFAVMDPAREVGGDFYDFFLIDDDHLCLIMADVSGKGVPAALFMMISKTILQSFAMIEKTPGEILTRANDALCANNQVEMFVTVWLGILEISTGRLSAANGGHEYPAVKKADGEFVVNKEPHSFLLGGLEGMDYKDYEMTLQPGDKIFLYTDGVVEAENGRRKMFGMERMLKALNEDTDASPEKLLTGVRKAVDDFVEEAEQFDDITMLCMEYRGSGS